MRVKRVYVSINQSIQSSRWIDGWMNLFLSRLVWGGVSNRLPREDEEKRRRKIKEACAWNGRRTLDFDRFEVSKFWRGKIKLEKRHQRESQAIADSPSSIPHSSAPSV